MPLKEKLDEAWGERAQANHIFKFQELIRTIHGRLQATRSAVDAIVANADFSGVDDEIKAVGAALRADVASAEASLRSTQAKKDFLDWGP